MSATGLVRQALPENVRAIWRRRERPGGSSPQSECAKENRSVRTTH